MPVLTSSLSTLTSVFVAFVAIAAYCYYVSQKPPGYLPWHDTDDWRELLACYDDQLAPVSKATYVPTSYGLTNVMMRGCSSSAGGGDQTKKKLAILFHGAGSNNLIYKDWIMPKLAESNQHCVVAVDFVCDVTRSVPRDGNPDNCPQNEEQLADWVHQIVFNLPFVAGEEENLKEEPIIIDVAGYSYGAFISFVTARHSNNDNDKIKVDKMVMMAPAATVAPLEFGWIWRAVYYSLVMGRSEEGLEWFFRYMLKDPAVKLTDLMSESDLRLSRAINKVGATVLKVEAPSYDGEILKEVFSKTKTLLLIGTDETVTNATLAVERAGNNGAQTKLYPNVGHLMLIQKNNEIEQDVINFLTMPSGSIKADGEEGIAGAAESTA